MSESDNFVAQATQFVRGAWEDVFRASNTVITQSRLYGFGGIQIIENPNIRQILESMNVVSGMLDTIISNLGAADFDLGTDNVRLLLNAKEQVSRLEAVAAALAAGDEALYYEKVELVRSLAPF
jgi:hypothetical protein